MDDNHYTFQNTNKGYNPLQSDRTHYKKYYPCETPLQVKFSPSSKKDINDIKSELQRSQAQIDILMEEKYTLKNTLRQLLDKSQHLSYATNTFLQNHNNISQTNTNCSQKLLSTTGHSEVKSYRERQELRENILDLEDKYRSQKHTTDQYKTQIVILEKQLYDLQSKLSSCDQLADINNELQMQLSTSHLEILGLKKRLNILEEERNRSGSMLINQQSRENNIYTEYQPINQQYQQYQQQQLPQQNPKASRNTDNLYQEEIIKQCTILMQKVKENQIVEDIFNEQFDSNENLLKLLVERQPGKLCYQILQFTNNLISHINHQTSPNTTTNTYQAKEDQQQQQDTTNSSYTHQKSFQPQNTQPKSEYGLNDFKSNRNEAFGKVREITQSIHRLKLLDNQNQCVQQTQQQQSQNQTKQVITNSSSSSQLLNNSKLNLKDQFIINSIQKNQQVPPLNFGTVKQYKNFNTQQNTRRGILKNEDYISSDRKDVSTDRSDIGKITDEDESIKGHSSKNNSQVRFVGITEDYDDQESTGAKLTDYQLSQDSLYKNQIRNPKNSLKIYQNTAIYKSNSKARLKERFRIEEAFDPLPAIELVPQQRHFNKWNKSSYNLLMPDSINGKSSHRSQKSESPGLSRSDSATTINPQETKKIIID